MDSKKVTYHFHQLFKEFGYQIAEQVATSVIEHLKDFHSSDNRSNEDDTYLNISEVSDKFKISVSQINKLRKKHKDFPEYRIGTTVRFKLKELESFFKSKY